jgi:predicted ArsR family transcriptional regulator
MIDARADDLSALRLLDEPARRKLYDWVAAQNEPVGREQAAAATGLSRALATFHLDKLADAGLLDATYRRLTGRVGPGAGRPARVYWRADREFTVSVPERRYANAADLFASALERIGGGGPPTELRQEAHEMGRRLSSGIRNRSRAGRPRLIRALESGGYEPVTDSAGSIRLRNCPFDALTDAHRPLVCGTNLALAEGIVDGAGATGFEPVLDIQPGFCCVTFRERTA